MPCEQTHAWMYCHEGGEVQTVETPEGSMLELKPGVQFGTNSACEMVAFLQTLKAAGITADESRDGTFSGLNAAAEKEGCLGHGEILEVVVHPASSGSETPGPPGPGGDSGTAQGAASVPAAGGVIAPPTHPDEDSGVPGTLGDDPPPEPRPGEPHRSHGREQPQKRTAAGEPVDLFRGVFYLEETDLLVPTAVMALAVVRRYRSGSANWGPFGWNWDHNHNVFLRELSSGDIARWDGKLHEDIFRLRGSSFDPPRGVFEGLSPIVALPHAYEITSGG